jgi:hypothetical protein
MRIYGNKERGIANLAAGRERARVSGMNGSELLRVPDTGTLLWTLRITDEFTGRSSVLRIAQGPRRNNLLASWLGGDSHQTGADGIVRALRRKLKTRWITSA